MLLSCILFLNNDLTYEIGYRLSVSILYMVPSDCTKITLSLQNLTAVIGKFSLDEWTV